MQHLANRRRRLHRRARFDLRLALPAALACALVRCAPGISVVSSVTPAPNADSTPVVVDAPARAAPWSIRVREDIDLWLHGFGMLQSDSTLVPYFRPGYSAELSARRARDGISTRLDASAQRLRDRLAANPALVGAQFIPMYFSSWDDLRQAADLFLSLQGNARAARDQRAAERVAVFAAYFTSAADRDWLSEFVLALDDERTRFYDRYWREEQRVFGPVFTAVDSLWRTDYGTRFDTFLRNSQQREGSVILSLPLAGEGRTLADATHRTTVAVGFPRDTLDAVAMVYVFAHEIVGSVANTVVADNTSPAEKRTGVSDRYSSLAAVRGGALLLGRIAPSLVPGYMAYYLGLARLRSTSGETAQRFTATFPLPESLADALQRQIDIILGGI